MRGLAIALILSVVPALVAAMPVAPFTNDNGRPNVLIDPTTTYWQMSANELHGVVPKTGSLLRAVAHLRRDIELSPNSSFHPNSGQPPSKLASTTQRRVSTTRNRARAGDERTAGGNAYSGTTGSASGGSIVDYVAGGDEVQNAKQAAGHGGMSYSGDALAGASELSMGPGGNAYTGDSGPARGGSVVNDAEHGKLTGTGKNTAGTGGVSGTGNAYGGNVFT